MRSKECVYQEPIAARALENEAILLVLAQHIPRYASSHITGGNSALFGIPILADQWYNVTMYVHHKIGVHVELEDLNEENFKAAIDSLSKDDNYRKNISTKHLATLYDQPQTALERAMWWMEHVLRHGGARHLRSPAANMPWSQYYEIELVMYLLLTTIVALLLFVLVVSKIRQLVTTESY